MSNDEITTISVSAIIGIVVLCSVGLIVYGYQVSGRHYYAMAHDCIALGDSFIPTGSDKAICLAPSHNPQLK